MIDVFERDSTSRDSFVEIMQESDVAYLWNADGSTFNSTITKFSTNHDILVAFQQLLLPKVITSTLFSVSDSVLIIYFCDILGLGVSRSISLDQNRRLMLDILIFNDLWYSVFARSDYKPNNHGLLHLPMYVHVVGPPSSYWSWWVEQIIRVAKKYKTQGNYVRHVCD